MVAGTQEQRIFFLLPLKWTGMISEGQMGYGVKLDGHVLHLHDEHGGGDDDHLHGPQGVILYHCLLKSLSLLAFRLSARI